MKIYFRNGKPFLPASQSKELCFDSLYDDFVQEFDEVEFVKNYYWNEEIKFFNCVIYYEELLGLLGTVEHRILNSDLCATNIDNYLEYCFDELFNMGTLTLGENMNLLENGILYEIKEFDEMTDDDFTLYFELQ